MHPNVKEQLGVARDATVILCLTRDLASSIVPIILIYTFQLI